MTKPELQRLETRIDRLLAEVLATMKPGQDDSIQGFEKARYIVHETLIDEIRRAQ